MMKDRPVDKAAPFAPKTGISKKLPIKLNAAAHPALTINQYVFFEKSIPLATTMLIIIITGDNNRNGDMLADDLYVFAKRRKISSLNVSTSKPSEKVKNAT